METSDNRHPKGRFAPSPTGRMHLGNVYAALISWLSARASGGCWLLRIEDLDPQRSKLQYARLIEDDLCWLGLDWDEGGVDALGPSGPYCQSLRSDYYRDALEKLKKTGYTYPCFCTRADIMATQAPHQTDGRIIYGGTCRPALPAIIPDVAAPHATRLCVPNSDIRFTDRIFGPQCVNLAKECGDFVLRRADGAWAYQLAVVVDDGLMGVTEVIRGCDLLLSAAQQIYLYNMLDLPSPEFAHLPLLCNKNGQRLSKRDSSLSMEHMRQHMTAEEIIGKAAYCAGLTEKYTPCRPAELIEAFRHKAILPAESITTEA